LTPRPDGEPGARVRLGEGEPGVLADRGATANGMIEVETGEVLRLDDGRTMRISAEPDGQQWVEVFDSETSLARSFAGIEH
jgi:hypothetical protein